MSSVRRFEPSAISYATLPAMKLVPAPPLHDMNDTIRVSGVSRCAHCEAARFNASSSARGSSGQRSTSRTPARIASSSVCDDASALTSMHVRPGCRRLSFSIAASSAVSSATPSIIRMSNASSPSVRWTICAARPTVRVTR